MECPRCSCWGFYIPGWLLDEWIREDVGYTDLTTGVLGITEAPAVARLVTRDKVVVCGLREAALVYERLGARVKRLVEEGCWAEPGTVLREARGPAGSLHAAWRVAQVLAAIGSAVATTTRLLVEKARKANPRVIVAVARKAPPGLRSLYYRCVLCGGATLHRMGLSETILVFPNHTRPLGGIDRVLERLREAKPLIGERSVVVEVDSLEEALAAAKSGVVDEIQLDHQNPEQLREVVAMIRAVNPRIRIAVGGGINLDNIEEYAAHVDVVVTSTPYWAKPADLTTKIEPADTSKSKN